MGKLTRKGEVVCKETYVDMCEWHEFDVHSCAPFAADFLKALSLCMRG